jgi:hypothetical protein
MDDAKKKPVDLTEAVNAIAEAIVSRVQGQLASTPVCIKPRLLDVPAAALYLGRTDKAIRIMVAGGKLPVVHLDERIQFDVRDLDRAIENAK